MVADAANGDVVDDAMPPPAIDTVAAWVTQCLRGRRFDLGDEKRLQVQIAEAFECDGVDFEREVRLSARDYPDFLIDGLAVECKLRGQPKRAIHRQLARYAENDRVAGILLCTNVSMGLPPDIGGKPAFFFSLGRGWL